MSNTPNTSTPANIKPATPSTPKATPTVEQLFNEVIELQKKVNAKEASKVAAPVMKTEIDWSKLTESAIFDMTIPIPAIEQEVPTWLDVHIKDPAYVCRWIHKTPVNLGPRKASGWDFFTSQDWDERFPRPLEFDAEGHYSYGDVVCMKLHKSKYFPLLRRNFEKTAAIHGKAKVREELAKITTPAVQDAIMSGQLDPFGETLKEDVVDEKAMEEAAERNKTKASDKEFAKI